MGHNVEVVSNGIMFGGYQAIIRDPETGVLTGATSMGAGVMSCCSS